MPTVCLFFSVSEEMGGSMWHSCSGQMLSALCALCVFKVQVCVFGVCVCAHVECEVCLRQVCYECVKRLC